MDRLLRDVRSAARTLRRRPGSTAGILAVLSLGIGLATSMFSLVDPFLFRRLPYGRPEELVVLNVRQDFAGSFKESQVDPPRLPTLSDIEAHTELFTAVAAYRNVGALRIRMANGPMFVRSSEVTGNLLDVLAGRPSRNSVLPEGYPVQAIADGLLLDSAARRLRAHGTEPTVGTLLRRVDGRGIRIAAVLPPDFVFPFDSWIQRTELLIPLGAEDGPSSPPSIDQLTIIARLQKGLDLDTVRHAIAARLGSNGGASVEVTFISHYLTRSVRHVARGALVASLFLLFVCCANVANLLLIRAVSRREEFGTRRALGASGADLARVMLAEVALLTCAGVLLALFVTRATVAGLATIMPEEYVTLGTPALTARGATFAVAAGFLALLVGLGTLALLSRLWSGPLEHRKPTVADGGMRLVRFVLTACQTGLAVVLVIAAGLLQRSQFNLNSQNPGLSKDAVVATVAYDDGYAGARLRADVDATLRVLRSVPFVKSAGAAMGPMLDKFLFFGVFQARGTIVSAIAKTVTPGYFDAAGATLRGGRWLREGDDGSVVVNESLANSLWPDVSPIGQVGLFNGKASTVVGIMADSFDVSLDRTPRPMVCSLLVTPTGCAPDCNRVSYVVRTSGTAKDLERPVQDALKRVNPDAVLIEVSSVGDRLFDSVKRRSFAALVLSTFGTAALLVCGTGLFSLLAFAVARQARDTAVRVAIGAQPRHIVYFSTRDIAPAVLLGLAFGLIVGRWTSFGFSRLLYSVPPGDWQTLVGAGGLVVLVAFAAVTVPLARALRMPVASILRSE